MSIHTHTHTHTYMPVPVAERSKAWVYARLLAAIVVSNPIGAWMFVCCVCCVLSGRGLCDELITHPRGVLPNVARCCV
jgi:hypothetical protein